MAIHNKLAEEISPPPPQGSKRGGLWPLAIGLGITAISLTAFVFQQDAAQATAAATEEQANQYIELALSLDAIQEGEVDAWYGAQNSSLSDAPTTLPKIRSALRELSQELGQRGQGPDEKRRIELRRKIKQLQMVGDIIANTFEPNFYKQTSTVYGISAPTHAEAERWHKARQQLDALLPGSGHLAERAKRFQAQFIIPEDRRKAVFERALDACRKQTLAQWELPKPEHITVKWDTKVPAAWHTYEGQFQSTLRVNQQAIALPGQALHLACHEGYPGHHTQFVLEDLAAGQNHLNESKLTLLRSRESVLREGAADAAVNLAFPLKERIAFLESDLFPLAGLNSQDAAQYARFEVLQRIVAGASLPILAQYYDQKLSADRAAIALEEEALISSAEALLGFTSQYGGYVVGYTLVGERINAWLSKNCGSEWSALRSMIEHPEAPRALPTADTLNIL